MELTQKQHKNGAAKIAAPTPYRPLVRVTDLTTLNQVWPRVRLGILALRARAVEIAKKTHNPGISISWELKHIRQRIDLGLLGRDAAALWQIMGRDDERMRGFMVTTIYTCPYQNAPQSLCVWLAYTFLPIKAETARGVLATIEKHGEDLGLEFVDGYSFNPKWDGWLRRYGKDYHAVETLFRKKLSYRAI